MAITGSYGRFICDSDLELASLALNAVEGWECYQRSTPSKFYKYIGGDWRLIGGVIVTEVTSAFPPFTGNDLKYLRLASGGVNLEFVTLAGGGDMLAANNLSDLTDVSIALTNLGVPDLIADAYNDAIARANHTGTQSADTITDGTTNKAYTAIEKTKLAGITSGATANDTDANLKSRANHTGTQAISTVTGLQGEIDSINATLSGKEDAGVAAAEAAAAESAANDYTDAEILELKDGVSASGDTLQKLYNLITAGFHEVVVANIAARNAYNVPSLPFNIFVTDDGDGNWALYKATTTGVAATFVKLSDPDLLNAAMSNAQIKTAYEANADTNAFTNALLAKLNGIASGATANSSDATLLARGNHTGTQSADTITDGSTNKAFTALEKTKLGAVASGATANDTDANLKARANHTGTQLAATISDFNAAALAAAPAETATTEGALINGAAEKTTPVDADFFGLMDSAVSNVLKKFSWANMKAKLKVYFDTVYTTTAAVTAQLASYAPLASPAFTGTPTFASGINTTELPHGIMNINTADQSQIVVSATNYYIAGSVISLPNPTKAGMKVGTTFTWRFYMSKTNLGTGIFQISIYRGLNGTTADTQDVLQTIGTQSTVVDSMVVDVTLTVTTIGAAGAYAWTICPMSKAASGTGFGVVTGTGGLFSGTVSGVAMNTAALKFGLGFKATTGTPTIRVVQVHARAYNMN